MTPPREKGWGLHAGWLRDKARFPTVRLDGKQGLGLTTSCVFTRVYCFMGSEVKSGVFGVTVRPFSAKAVSAQMLLAKISFAECQEE